MPFLPLVRALLLLLPLVLLAAPVVAQEFGQWWWRGSVDLGYKSFTNELDGSTLVDYTQQELELGLDVNGYVLHPAVGSFQVGVDLIVNQLDGTQTIDTDRIGGRGTLELFERGKYPVRLFFERQGFDYSDFPTDDPFTLLGAPETLTRWGGRGRLRTGFLKGSLFGFEHTAYDLLEGVAGRDVDDTQFYDWSRSFGAIRHRLRVERRERRFGVVDLGLEDFIVNLEESGELGGSWQWDLNSNGIYRTLRLRDGNERTFETYFLRNRFLRPVRERDLLDIRHSHGMTMSEGRSDDRHALSVFYRWRPRPHWEIGPFGEYVRRSAGEIEASTPRVGLVVTWNRAWDAVTTLLSGQTSYSTVSRSGNGTGAFDESRFAYALRGSFTHQATEGFSEEVELEMTRDELETSPGRFLELPDLGAGLGGVGIESKDRLRLTLEQRWRSRLLSVYGEWSNRRSDDMLGVPDFDLESLTANLALSGRRWSLRGHAGETELTRQARTPERFEFTSLSASVRPVRFLRLEASYRTDSRRIDLLPTLDSEQLEVGLELQVGQIIFEAHAFERLQDSMELDGRNARGVIVSLTRRFGGWLPVITGDERRGFIR